MIVQRKFPKPCYKLGNPFVYFIGAEDYQLSSCERFDLINDKWQEMPSLPFSCIVNSTMIMDQYIYAFLFNSYIARMNTDNIQNWQILE